MGSLDLFQQRLNAVLHDRPDEFAWQVTMAVRLRQGHESQELLIDLTASPPRCQEAINPAADCCLEIDANDLALLLADPGRSRQLFLDGRLRVTGRLDVAVQFPRLLSLAMLTENSPGLAVLWGKEFSRTFLADYWPDQVCTVHDLPERLHVLYQLLEDGDLDRLLAHWPHAVRLADRFQGKLVSPAEAGRLYRTGHHLAFNEVERVFAPLQSWLEQLKLELNLPLNTFGRCLVYASPAQVGEGLHFDQNANLVIQLRGRKQWDFAPNRQVHFPTARYASVEAEPAAELRDYAAGEFPRTLPADAQTVVLEPGSVLFMPRGWWHQTQAHEASLSLNFTFDQPTWADVVLPELRRSLLKHEAWRQLASGAGSPLPERAAEARRTLEHLLAQLAADLSAADAAAALARLRPVRSTE